MIQKPDSCKGCYLYGPPCGSKSGFVPSSGDGKSGVLILGEAAGEWEAQEGMGFVGKAGMFLFQSLQRIGIYREGFKVQNVLSCQPYKNLLAGQPFEQDAINHCRPNLEATIQEMQDICRENGKTFVILTLGKVAFKAVMGFQDRDPVMQYDYICYPFWNDQYKAWVIPAYHPSYMMRGQTHLLPLLQFAFQRAIEIADGGMSFQTPNLILDPPAVGFQAWIDSYFKALEADPSLILAYDIETPMKQGTDEEEVAKEEDDDYTILRCSFAYKEDEAISVPWNAEMMSGFEQIFSKAPRLAGWNSFSYDRPRIQAQMPVVGQEIDGMFCWHVLNSSMPKGLGFVAPFYAQRQGVWKYTSDAAPAQYNAIDSLVTLQCVKGIKRDMEKQNLWPVFERHVLKVHEVFKYMSEKGVPLDLDLRAKAEAQLSGILEEIEEKMSKAVPPDAKSLKIFKKTPKDLEGLIQVDGVRQAKQCPVCGALDVKADHFKSIGKARLGKCQICGKSGKKHPVDHELIGESENPCHGAVPKKVEVPCKLWAKREDFKVSKVSLIRYQEALKHQAIKSRKDNKITFDEKAIIQLVKKYPNDPLYPIILEHRSAQKLLGTYIGITQENGKIKGGIPVGRDGRVHCEFTSNPSTLRSACIAKGTFIDVVRDITKHPKGIPIEDVKVGDRVYTLTNEGKLTTKPVINTFNNGIKNTVRVHWEGGNGKNIHRGFLDLTPDHLVRLRDGNWKAAGSLIPCTGKWSKKNGPDGDRVSALHRQINGWGYSVLWPTGYGRASVRDHRCVFESVHGYLPEHVHHKDHNKLNNLPENLEAVTNSEHAKITVEYTYTPERKAKASKDVKDKLERLRQFLVGHDYPEPIQWCGYRPKDFNPNSSDMKGYKRIFFNHRITKIEILEEPCEVFDLEVEDTHNYFANEICVHNCQKPNLQNQPRPKGPDDPASIIRNLFVAGPGSTFIATDFGGIEAVLVGYFARAKEYIELCKIDVHSFYTSHGISALDGRIRSQDLPDVSWDRDRLKDYLSHIKKDFKAERNNLYKHLVHACVTGDHEVLTPSGWTRFDSLEDGVPVAQWDNGVVNFVVPSKVTRAPYRGDLYKLKTRSLSLEMTPNHRIVWKNTHHSLKETEAQDFERVRCSARIPFNGVKLGGLPEVLDVLRLAVAIQADGTLLANNKVRFHLKKARKINRLKLLLTDLGIPYEVREYPSDKAGAVNVLFKLPDDKLYKYLDHRKNFNVKAFLDLDLDGRQTFLKELPYWDGHIKTKSCGSQTCYISTNLHNIEAVQAIGAISGVQMILATNPLKPNSKPCYKLSLNNRVQGRVTGASASYTKSQFNGMVYCVTVPSGAFVVRHQGKVSVTGNSNFGQSARGAQEKILLETGVLYPVATIQRVMDVYHELFPKIKKWQWEMLLQVEKDGFLRNPFGYVHRFSRPFEYQYAGKAIVKKQGPDSNKIFAFLPQSTAAGIIKEAMLRLYFDRFDEAGQYLRLLIHDELFSEVPIDQADHIIAIVEEEMGRPITQMPLPSSYGMGDYLTIGTESKQGLRWGSMK